MSASVSQQPTTSKFILPDVIDDDRTDTLLSYAAQLRSYGAEEEEIREKVLAANRERCKPPLQTPRQMKKLESVIRWASKKTPTTHKRKLGRDDERLIASAEAYARAYYVRKKGTKKRTGYGISMRSIQSVALALCQIMRDDARLTVGVIADCRTVAEKSGLSPKTAARALLYLSGAKVHPDVHPLFSRIHDERIREEINGGKRTFIRHAYIYFLRRCSHDTHILAGIGKYETCVTSAPFAPSSHLHDAFVKRRCAAAVYDCLPVCNQVGAKEKTNFCLRSVKEAFKFLSDFGLVEKKDGLWVRTEKSLDEVAIERGTAGTGERKRQGHQREREIYRSGDVCEEALGFKALREVRKEEDRAECRDGNEPFPSDDDLRGLRETTVSIDDGKMMVTEEEGKATPFPSDKDLRGFKETEVFFDDSEATKTEEEEKVTPPGDIFVDVVVDLFPGAQIVETRDMQSCPWHRELTERKGGSFPGMMSY